MSEFSKAAGVKYPATCGMAGCNNLTEWRAEGRAWSVLTPHNQRNNKNCMTFEIGAAVCSDHKDVLTKENLISDAGWAVLIQPFQAMNLSLPDRESLEIDLVPLEPEITEGGNA